MGRAVGMVPNAHELIHFCSGTIYFCIFIRNAPVLNPIGQPTRRRYRELVRRTFLIHNNNCQFGIDEIYFVVSIGTHKNRFCLSRVTRREHGVVNIQYFLRKRHFFKK